MAFKAVLGPRMSLTVFAVCQIAIDSEVVLRFLWGMTPLHGWVHTLLGSLLVAGLSVILGRPLGNILIRWWNVFLTQLHASFLHVKHPITWATAISGAVLGAWSHVALDSIIHGRMKPLAPISDRMPLLGIIGSKEVHDLCYWAGALGICMLASITVVRIARHRTRIEA